MTGKVWLVGAGPSEAELLTVKAKRVIEQAEAVVYDALIGRSVLDIIPKSAERIYAGKRAGRHAMPQEEINRLLLSLAEQGKKVVRLKGGDPFLFGRGGEELELLVRHGIPFEIVPGVSSALAVPAYFGIPVTHRELASSVHIVTGHRKQGEELRINFRALKEAGGTLVFLMGVSALHEIAEGLLEAGMDPQTPAAVLQSGACGRQRKMAGTLAVLEKEAARQSVSTPAVIVVGEVAAYGERFAWYEKLPLFGRRYLVTRPGKRGLELADRLRELGAEAVEAPAITIEGIHPNQALRKEVFRLSVYRCLVFTSPSGVVEFMRELFDMGKDARHLSGTLLAAIGRGTAGALEQYGLLADLVPEVYSGKALGALLAEHCREGDRVLLARSNIGNPELPEELRKKGIVVTDTAVYRTFTGEGLSMENKTPAENADQDAGSGVSREAVMPDAEYRVPGEEAHRDEENEGSGKCAGQNEVQRMDGVFFTSASTVRGFVSMFPGMDLSKVEALCIGGMTAREAEGYGMRVRIAKRADTESLVKLAVEAAAIMS